MCIRDRGNGKQGSKGKFEGNCHYCGTYGHRISECRKKDMDMKGKGKGYDLAQGPGWPPSVPNKGKGKGNKGMWGPAKGSYGKGGKGIYGFEDDWTEGGSGYQFGHGDTPLWYTDLAAEAVSEWKTRAPRNTFKPTQPAPTGGRTPAPPGGNCSHCSSCQRGNPKSWGRFAALADDQCEHDHNSPVPMMMLRDEGHVPPEQATRVPAGVERGQDHK